MSQTYLTTPSDEQINFDSHLVSTDVLSNYSKLNQIIDNMHKTVQHVIQKHESQFLFAYRNHVKKMKKELNQIKNKSQEQQKMFSANDRIKYLEKQIALFREESLKLYDKLEKVTQQLDGFRKKYDYIFNAHQASETTVKEYIKQTKIDQVQKNVLSKKIQALEIELYNKNQEIVLLKEKVDKKIVVENYTASLAKTKNFNMASLVSDRSGKTRYAPDNLNKSQTFMRKSSFRFKQSITTEDNEFKEYFFDCLNAVKKTIAYRKGSDISPNQIKGISQFREGDKFLLIEMFLSHQKLLTFMYQKLFPDAFFKNKLDGQRNFGQLKDSFALPKVTQNPENKRVNRSNLSMI